MITVYLAVDGVAEGAHEIDERKDLLTEIKRYFPGARGVISNKEIKTDDVLIVTTKDDKKK